MEKLKIYTYCSRECARVQPCISSFAVEQKLHTDWVDSMAAILILSDDDIISYLKTSKYFPTAQDAKINASDVDTLTHDVLLRWRNDSKKALNGKLQQGSASQ